MLGNSAKGREKIACSNSSFQIHEHFTTQIIANAFIMSQFS